jgi:prepilin-type N-terminal cleavage/methylation domain-containing protein
LGVPTTMLRCLKFFPKCRRSGSVGMTLPEVLVSVAITGIVGSLAFNLITDFTRRAWEHESKSKAIDERELAANIIRRELSQFVTSVTGPYGEVVQPADFWRCTPSSCEMKVNYRYRDINGGESTVLLGNPSLSTPSPLRAECVDISDARLAPGDVKLHEKAKMDFPGDTPANSKCLKCPAGKAPQISVNMYRFDANTGAPSVIGTRTFPQAVGRMANQGSLAMGICVDWPAYKYNVGTAVTPLLVDRYDRWAVTLIPVYPRLAQRGGVKDEEIKQSLQSMPSKILISPSKRLGPELRVTPVR